MFTALDSNNQRVYADTVEKGTSCFCQACGEPMRIRRGSKRRTHFSHFPQSECVYSLDRDYKSEWHVRMQDYFPREVQERRFIDDKTGEVHIADVFIDDSNTVLEFQHSPISVEEFQSRTYFHLNNGRRIAWFFDESSQSSNSIFGRFKPSGETGYGKYNEYHWMRSPRAFLAKGPDIVEDYYRYSIFVYTGTEGDIFHRIVDHFFEYEDVIFSSKVVNMNDFEVDAFFEIDEYWPLNIRSRRQHEQWHYNYFKTPLNIRLKNQRKFRF